MIYTQTAQSTSRNISCFAEYSKEYRLLYIDGLVQDCSNSIANALELPQSRTKPSICVLVYVNIDNNLQTAPGCNRSTVTVRLISNMHLHIRSSFVTIVICPPYLNLMNSNPTFDHVPQKLTTSVSLSNNFNPPGVPDYSVRTNQYHGCWFSGSLRRQGIKSHDVDHVG